MKTPHVILSMAIALCLLNGLYGQDSLVQTPASLKVKKHTVLGNYEKQLVLPAVERQRMKLDRIATIKKRRSVIDTLDISDRRRRKLLRELYTRPTSNHWERLLADLDLEDEFE